MKFHKLPHLTRDVTGQHYRPVPSDVSLPRLSERRRRLKFRLLFLKPFYNSLQRSLSVGACLFLDPEMTEDRLARKRFLSRLLTFRLTGFVAFLSS